METQQNSLLDELRKLRSLYVAARRQCVTDSLLHDLPAGNERRLCQIQNAIAAVDAAIADEEALVRPAPQDDAQIALPRNVRPANVGYVGNGHDEARAAMNGNGWHAADSAPEWDSYAAWRAGRRNGERAF